MNPTNFPESNCVLHPPDGMTPDECDDLAVFRDGRNVISCWKLTLADRIKLLVSGRLWLGVVGGRTQPPVWLSADCPFKRQPPASPAAGIEPSVPWPHV